jgi:hypothetical protein
MAGGIADAEKNRPIQVPGALQRLRTPRVPIDRIMSMLLEIRTGFVNQAIGSGREMSHEKPPHFMMQ